MRGLEAKARGASLCAGFPQPAQTLYQHRLAQKGILAIDQVIKELVVSRRSEVKELFNRRFLGPGIAPPLPLEIQDLKFEFGKATA